jgi:hypothetical protein
MCYQGAATFEPLGATATWQELDIAGSSGWGAEYDPNQADTTTRFDSDRTTTTELTKGGSVTHAVDIRTDRAAFSLTGINPSQNNQYDYLAVAPPFNGTGFGETVDARSGLECRPDDTDTATGDTPPPTSGGTSGDGGEKTPPPTQTPYAQDFNVIGTCELPTVNGTKTGLSVEYYDSEYDAEYLTMNLTYKGVHVDRTIHFETPKGYYMACVGAGSETDIDPGDVGQPQWPDNTTVEFPNGTQETFPNGTVGEFPDGSNVTTPPGENASVVDPPAVDGEVGFGNGTTEPWNASGFEGGNTAFLGAGAGGGGGALIGEESGSGAPIWLTVVPAAGVVAYAYFRRRDGGGGSGGQGGAGGAGRGRGPGGAA